MKKYVLMSAMAFAGALLALAGAWSFGWGNHTVQWAAQSPAPVHLANYTPGNGNAAVADFTFAAEQSLPEVVHIQSSIRVKSHAMQGFDFQDMPEPFRQFFGSPRGGGSRGGQQPDDVEQASGSGVIIGADGYIVTNNHVVRDAEELTVTLNDKREFKAKVIGTDPSTDLALVKIDADGLPFMQMANSDNIKVGEWVVAIGNPFNLTSTVTAGIVSAKGRDLHIVEDKAPIESFIQTDAVVNPGNSGGALVNLNGELIGINTAIASPTGVFAGYAFAIPSNLVAKVIGDIRQFGVVQRGYLGIVIRDLSAGVAKEKNTQLGSGVYVDSLAENSAAGAAGIRAGDVVTKIDGQNIKTSSELLEMVGKHRPGDQLAVTVQRGGSEREYSVTLKNRAGSTDAVKKTESSAILSTLGADFETISKKEARELNIEGGVKVSNLAAGKLANQTDMHDGFVITKANNQLVKSVEGLSDLLQNAKDGGVMLEGVYPGRSGRFYYAFGLQ